MTDPEPIYDPEFLGESAEELYEAAPCGYLTTTGSGLIVRVNRTLTEWLGYSHDELMAGLRITDLLSKGGRIFYETHLALMLRVERSVDEIALDFIRANGSALPTLVNARQRQAIDGTGPVYHRYTVFNATERRRYERQLLAARDLFETTLTSIGDGVISTDTAGAVTFMNPVAAELSGWDPDAAIGRPIDEVLVLVREDTGEPIENPIRHALRTSNVVGLANHTLLLSKSGSTYVVDDSASPIRDDHGVVTGAVLVFRDVSERRKSERALADAYRQLEASAAELRRSNEDLSQFAYVASHDLRSPLNTVRTFIQLLERKYGDKLGEGTELLGHVTAAARRMASLIDDLLKFSAIGSSGEFSTVPVDAESALTIAIENLESTIAESGAVVTHTPLPEVPISSTSLVQLFQNLIGNAIRYRSAQTPAIHVSAEEADGKWRFACADNGIGIPAEYQAQIFEPFRRLHGHDVPGSGIGLAVCRKIVQRYRGDIWVESTVGQGSIFYFTIPVTPTT